MDASHSTVTVITNRRGWFDLNLQEFFRYRDLVFMFVKRNFTANYKQTILGPAWAIIQPFLTTVVFTIVFGKLAKLPTDGIPPFLFYFCGNVAWGYFSGCLTQISSTFSSNARIFGKVYFPRLVMPASVVVSQMIQLGIQFLFLAGFLVYFSIAYHTALITWRILFLPFLILNMALLSLGCGVIVSSLTTKYRDLGMLVGFGVHLWMYATPVVYSIDIVPEKWRALYLCNPMAVTIETFRNMFFGPGSLTVWNIISCWGITILIALGGILLFNRVEKNFMDTV